MTMDNATPTSDPVTPPPDQDLAAKLAKAEADKLAAEGRLRLLQKDHTTLKAQKDALEAGVSKSESDKIASLRLKLAYENGIPTDLFPLVTGNTEAEINAQVKIILTQFAKSDSAVAPAPDDAGSTTSATTPATRPAPISQGGPSWLEKYATATPVERAAMDRDVANGKVKPW
jgi:hypothetical protein